MFQTTNQNITIDITECQVMSRPIPRMCVAGTQFDPGSSFRNVFATLRHQAELATGHDGGGPGGAHRSRMGPVQSKS